MSTEETNDESYAAQLGERMRAIRQQKGLSLNEVEQSTNQEFKASVMGAYERGERIISVPRLERLARFYNVTIDQIAGIKEMLENEFTLAAALDDESAP